MKIGLRGGHSPNCIGAVGYLNEYVECQKVYKRVTELLKAAGNTVIDCNTSESDAQSDLYTGTNKANANNVDFYASIHMNAGGGTGVEVWAYDSSSTVAVLKGNAICRNISSQLGIANRGVKFNPSFHDTRCPNCQSIIIESLFVDTLKDKNAYDVEKLSRAIANGLDNRVPLVAPVKKEVKYDMKELVVYFGDADVFAAVLVSQKYQCPMMKLSDFKSSGLKVEKIIQIGGNKEDINRYATFKNAAKLL